MVSLQEQISSYLLFCDQEKKLNGKTVKAYRIDLQEFYQFLLTSNLELGKYAISQFVIYLQSKAKPNTVKRKLASVKAFLNYLVENELLEQNPFNTIKIRIKEPFILPKTIPLENIQKLFTHIYSQAAILSNHSSEKAILLRDIALLELMIGTGLRVSELCTLTRDSINLDSGYIKIFGKGAKERIIQIPNQNIIRALLNYDLCRLQSVAASYYFVNKLGERLSEQSVRLMIKKHATACGIKQNITPHMFRHSFASLLLDQDVDIRYIQQILGHSSILTTQIYTHVSSAKQRDILAIKNPRNLIFVECEG